MKFNKVSCYRIFVKDAQASCEWYGELLQLNPTEKIESFAAFEVGDIRFEIVAADAKNPFSNGGGVVYWLVDDLERASSKVIEMGGKRYRGPLEVLETKSKIMQMQDPFGNLLGFEASI